MSPQDVFPIAARTSVNSTPHFSILQKVPLMTRISFVFLAFFTSFLFVGAALAQSSPDLLLLNGHIITVDSRDSIAQALLVHDGKISAVGANDEIRKLAPNSAKLLDLPGLTVTPGLIDTHCHI